MAIGDAAAFFIGAAAGNRQPASGVEEQITAVVTQDKNDAIQAYDGTTALTVIEGAVTTGIVNPASLYIGRQDLYNMSWMITNTLYFRKAGGTDKCYGGGVQTNV